MSGKVIVIGGGVIGAACAWYLCRDGWQVTVVDRGEFGKGCSHANCGLVCPSHVLPLAGPGAIRDALKALLRPDGALSIRPRIDLRLWGWLFRFALRCNARDMLAAGQGIHALLASSRQLFEQLLDEAKLDCEWESRGLLFVFANSNALKHHDHTHEILRDRFGIAARRYEGETLQELEPALRPGLAGGYHYAGDAHLRPDRLMSSWRAALQARGVVIQERTRVRAVQSYRGRARSIITERGEQVADAFVVAAGAWTPQLSQSLGFAVPIQPGKGYSLTMPRPALCPRLPLIFEEHRVAVTPMQSGYRLGSTMEFAGYDRTLRPARLKLLQRAARYYLREPLAEPVLERWYGWRPMTHDGLPLIGRVPRCANLYIAAGHNMLGLSMAPATGQLVAELLVGRTPHLDPAPYSPRRF